MTRFVQVLGFTTAVLSACSGGPASSADGGPATAGLVGSWRRDTDYGASRRIVTFHFAGDGSMTADESFVVGASGSNAGCDSTNTYVGTWSAAGSTLTVTATAGTIVTTGCDDPSLDTAGRPATADELTLVGGSSPFVLVGNTLSFTAFRDPAAFTRT